MYKVWVGKRESDILTYKYFDYSITFYGSNCENNVAFSTKKRNNASYTKSFIEFTKKNLKRILENNSDVEIHFYNTVFAYKMLTVYPEIEPYIVNINAQIVLNTLRHKTLSRLWLNNYVDTPAICLLDKNDCTIELLKKKFGTDFDKFIIQKNYSGGGEGTYLIDSSNIDTILNSLKKDELYLISPYYYPNESLSCHIIIDSEKCIVFPVSKQVLYTNNNTMEYVGNVYIDLFSELSQRVKQIAKKIGLKLQQIGYRGVCGFDFIATNNKVLLIEINPRFQGSSYVINDILYNQGLPSLFELNSMCFNDTISNDIANIISSLNPSCSNHYIKFQSLKDIQLAKSIIHNDKYQVFTDGFLETEDFELGCYLLRYISPCEEF